jgi:hypothetical protein
MLLSLAMGFRVHHISHHVAMCGAGVGQDYECLVMHSDSEGHDFACACARHGVEGDLDIIVGGDVVAPLRR